MATANSSVRSASEDANLYEVYDTITLRRIYSGYSHGYAHHLIDSYPSYRLETTPISSLVHP